MVRAGRRLPVVVDVERPRTRGDCENGPRPCPWISCRLHLATERITGLSDEHALELLESMGDTCAQDVASRGESTLQEISDALGLPLMTVADTEKRAKRKAQASTVMPEFPEHPEDPYVRYMLMGADELAEVTALLRKREREKP